MKIKPVQLIEIQLEGLKKNDFPNYTIKVTDNSLYSNYKSLKELNS